MRTLPLLAFLLAPAAAAAPPVPDALDSLMDRDPEIPVAEAVRAFPNGLLELWLAALDRPDVESQTRAALSVALAHERGMPGLAAAVPKLVRNLDRDGQPAGARLAAAKALVALAATEAAPSLLAHARTDPADFREAVEPALARWDHRPARDLWLGRLTAATPRYDGTLSLAVRCLAAVREEKAVAKLRDVALSAEAPPAFRLEAARAVVAIHPKVADTDLARLTTDAGSKTMTTRLVAATLLGQHTGDAAIQLLQQVARDPEPAVARVAVTRLYEIDPKLVLAVLEPVFASPDDGVRRVGVDALFRLPSTDHVRQLGDRLDDPHPDVRVAARRALRELAATPDHRPGVVEQTLRAVGGPSWRTQEQGAMLLAQLDLKGEAKRLLPLLASERAEVMAASGWALRVLAVPETLAPVLDHVKARRDQILKKSVPTLPADGMDRQLSQLIQFLGAARHTAADADLRKIVPRFTRGGAPPSFTPIGGETRAAAIWALGVFHEGKSDDSLVDLIEPRLTGDSGNGRDDPRVRRAAAVAVGRLRAKGSLPGLTLCAAGTDPSTQPIDERTQNACLWAIAKINGTPFSPPAKRELPQRDWFVVPLK